MAQFNFQFALTSFGRCQVECVQAHAMVQVDKTPETIPRQFYQMFHACLKFGKGLGQFGQNRRDGTGRFRSCFRKSLRCHRQES